ncbi:hypothetical protein BUALT_Bualt04G0157500 [Buddleja alternifolia]|uniref:Bidirectional sugar transporter SWEET n=1 Tax=Buddleja alternifolia TaxID=168488 RepID=A0AAV6XWN2_9LAMI|nr:hypothetical protein BUALT_Bualt04G0157500 [Buddleja alternifolia]
MHGQDLIRTVVGIVGNVISGFMFLSPTPTFVRIFKNKSTEEFHPYPYLACVMNCLFWIFYGLPAVHPDSTLVITINAAGLVLELIYLTIFFKHTTKKNRLIILSVLAGECLLLAGVAALTLHCFHTHEKRSMVVGIICCVFGIIMYASPLSILWKVIKTKSAEFLPVWLCLAGFLNGVTWFAYANLKIFDLYIAIGNGVGGLLGLIQLIVWTYYTVKEKRRGPKDDKAGEVQLQKTATNV